MKNLEELSVVALLKDMPDKHLIRGQVGTVVEVLSPSVGIVEFCDDEGYTYALETLDAESLLQLHHRPLEQVA